MSLRTKLLAILCIVGFVLAAAPLHAQEAEEEVFTQGQLAVAIVRSLGLENEVGFDQSEQGYATFLQSRGIAPLINGEFMWDVNASVDREVLAVVVVQTLGLKSYVQDLMNIAHYVAVCEDRDISIEDVRKVLSNIFVVNVLVDIVGPTEPTPLTPTVGF
jgi:hypothetical protein